MNEIEFTYLAMIAVSLIIGFILGTVACIIVTAKETRELKEDAEKFRDLYFEEMDKWKSKYDQNDYEAY
jgi:ABC-type methionine transport system permease subunit